MASRVAVNYEDRSSNLLLGANVIENKGRKFGRLR